MMFAMEGPVASICAPSGVWAATHIPASRPPGTPPVPARNEVALAVLMLAQDPMASHTATATVAAVNSARPYRVLPRASRVTRSTSESKPAARIATGAATGSRYWYPFTGQGGKNTIGTTIQQTTSDSRHDHLCRRHCAASVPAASSTTASPIATGTTERENDQTWLGGRKSCHVRKCCPDDEPPATISDTG